MSAADRQIADELLETLRAMMEETVLAGYPGGDRVQTLANIRALRAERDALREEVRLLREGTRS